MTIEPGGRRRSDQGRWVARDPAERFAGLQTVWFGDSSQEVGPCFLWSGRLTEDAYPLFDVAGQGPVRAHRWVVEQCGIVIPAGHTVDHLCHTFSVDCPGGLACLHRRCVRLDHLEVLTNRDNVLRRHARDRALITIAAAA